MMMKLIEGVLTDCWTCLVPEEWGWIRLIDFWDLLAAKNPDETVVSICFQRLFLQEVNERV